MKLTFKQFLQEASNHMGERQFNTYAGWKRAVKLIYPHAKFTGDKDIDSARHIGEWDGEVGVVFKDAKEQVQKHHGYPPTE